MSTLTSTTDHSDLATANQFMRDRLLTLSPTDQVNESVGRMLQQNVSGAPVVGSDETYLGVFSEKCCINALTDAIEVASEAGLHQIRVREFMKADLVTISGTMDVFDAIDHLLSHRISGAPVTDSSNRFEGVFSEKTAMRVLSAALHDGLPGTHVHAYMNVDRNRIIDSSDLLLDVAQKFRSTPYRRLPVLRDGNLIGQVSRRDVLRSEYRLTMELVANPSNELRSERYKNAIADRQVGDFMDPEALTITPSTDLLGIIQMFLNSPYRRLPVVEDTKLAGMVSRRDVIEVAAKIMHPKKTARQSETLYLSGSDRESPAAFG